MNRGHAGWEILRMYLIASLLILAAGLGTVTVALGTWAAWNQDSFWILILRFGCALGDGTQCAAADFDMSNGPATLRDPPLQLKLLERGCRLHSAWACSNLSRMLDGPRALMVAKQSCAYGPFYCVELGRRYRDGEGVSQDESLAEQLLSRACLENSDTGCAGLGILYRYSTSLRSLEKAKAAYAAACAGDRALACDLLAALDLEGLGPPSDEMLQEARNALARACQLHPPAGCVRLAEGLRDGNPWPIDTAEADRLFERACRHGLRRACRAREDAAGAATVAPSR